MVPPDILRLQLPGFLASLEFAWLGKAGFGNYTCDVLFIAHKGRLLTVYSTVRFTRRDSCLGKLGKILAILGFGMKKRQFGKTALENYSRPYAKLQLKWNYFINPSCNNNYQK